MAAGAVRRKAAQRSEVFVPVTLRPAATTPAADIRIEQRRGALAVNVGWPLGASAECAGSLREVLR